MTRARARSLWLAWPVVVAACSSSSGAQTNSSLSAATTIPTPATSATTTVVETIPPETVASSPVAVPVTVAPIDPSVLIPLAIGNKQFPAPADELAAEHHGFSGDPNATLQAWMITPMAVPSGPDVRLLGFERTIGISSTTATFLTGAIDPETALATIAATIAPDPTYTITPTTRTEGTITIRGFDAQPTTVQGDPPGWSVEASMVNQLGIVRITRKDYAFDKVVPTFSDLPTELQSEVANPDAIAVNIGGVLSSITYEDGVAALSDSPVRRTRLSYDIDNDFPTAAADLSRLLTSGWETNEQPDAMYFTSTTTNEVWTLDIVGGTTTHLTYDTGS